MGQIMATKYITPREDYPQYDYEQKYIQAESEKPDISWGLTLKERKRIWTDIILAEDKATEEAEGKYPIMGNDPDFDINNVDKNTALTKKLMDKYTTEVYQKHGITEAIGDSIGIEGLKYGWPFP